MILTELAKMIEEVQSFKKYKIPAEKLNYLSLCYKNLVNIDHETRICCR